MVETTSEEQNKVKRMEKHNSFRDLWDNIKCTNIPIIGVPEEEEKKKWYEKMFEEIIVENFLSIYLDFCVSSLFLHSCSIYLNFLFF